MSSAPSSNSTPRHQTDAGGGSVLGSVPCLRHPTGCTAEPSGVQKGLPCGDAIRWDSQCAGGQVPGRNLRPVGLPSTVSLHAGVSLNLLPLVMESHDMQEAGRGRGERERCSTEGRGRFIFCFLRVRSCQARGQGAHGFPGRVALGQRTWLGAPPLPWAGGRASAPSFCLLGSLMPLHLPRVQDQIAVASFQGGLCRCHRVTVR